MIRKLVEVDANGYYREVDRVRLRREAQALKNFILSISVSEDHWDFHGKVLPLCDAVLNDTVSLPFNRDRKPLKQAFRDFALPDDFERAWAPFWLTLTGYPRNKPDFVTKDGVNYRWAEFEDP